MSEREVIAWADEKILSMDSPSHDLIELSLHGPSKCLERKRPAYKFSARPAKLSYSQRFALRASSLDISSDTAVMDFVIWICNNIYGPDLNYNLREVELSIYVEDLVSEYGKMDEAIKEVRKDMPALMDRCKTISKDLFGKCG